MRKEMRRGAPGGPSTLMADAPAEQEIHEAAGELARPRRDIPYGEPVTQTGGINQIPAIVSRKSADFDRGGGCRPGETTTASGLSERNCSHRAPHPPKEPLTPFTPQNLQRTMSKPSPQRMPKISHFFVSKPAGASNRRRCGFAATAGLTWVVSRRRHGSTGRTLSYSTGLTLASLTILPR
jgi:hypothetical protein